MIETSTCVFFTQKHDLSRESVVCIGGKKLFKIINAAGQFDLVDYKPFSTSLARKVRSGTSYFRKELCNGDVLR